MSTVEADVDVGGAPAAAGERTELELTDARMARVGEFEVRRLLPLRRRRTVGPWCFVDHYGPRSVDGGPGMRVPPHPHMGLQTVTWLFEGDVLHRDSLGSEQMIKPGQLNLMTAGRGIAHSEQSPAKHGPRIHGVQLWVAMPDVARDGHPAFEHHAALPVDVAGAVRVCVFMGSLRGVASPATTFSRMVGADIAVRSDAATVLEMDPAFEHAVFAAGRAQVEDVVLEPGHLLRLATGREALTVVAEPGARLILLGGVPLAEPVLMWWNFVARTPEEIASATSDWNQRERFGEVDASGGARMAAPDVDLARLRLRAGG